MHNNDFTTLLIIMYHDMIVTMIVNPDKMQNLVLYNLFTYAAAVQIMSHRLQQNAIRLVMYNKINGECLCIS